MNDFLRSVARHTGAGVLHARGLQTIQVNLGLRCNMACRHCHVAAGPHRQESMTWQTMTEILDLVERSGCRLVDLTGGAPELHPEIRRFVTELRRKQVAVQVRTNLTVHTEPSVAGLAVFFSEQRVRLVGSMPCYLEQNVDLQRGTGTHARSLAALRILNGLGYGVDPGLPLDLVYNPGGPSLPPDQCRLEADYRRELQIRYGVVFTNLLTIANMPIGRFRADLRRQNREADYWNLLRAAFNPGTLEEVMCRNQISIGWDGTLYDCDFNLALGLGLAAVDKHVTHSDPRRLAERLIATGEHCFGCTAGSGSSCRGALVA
ncbi:MAG: arsenosugar biosynthesis radical SAM protein ArsS [Magnetococcus sp. DMHC-1]